MIAAILISASLGRQPVFMQTSKKDGDIDIQKLKKEYYYNFLH